MSVLPVCASETFFGRLEVKTLFQKMRHLEDFDQLFIGTKSTSDIRLEVLLVYFFIVSSSTIRSFTCWLGCLCFDVFFHIFAARWEWAFLTCRSYVQNPWGRFRRGAKLLDFSFLTSIQIGPSSQQQWVMANQVLPFHLVRFLRCSVPWNCFRLDVSYISYVMPWAWIIRLSMSEYP